MSQPLRVLHLEDNRNYSALVQSKLAADGFAPEIVCVETREDFQTALEQGGYDLIIADYFLPTYDGLKALKLAQEKQPETPILLVSGTIGEEAAVESLRAGATDYVLKHWPERLVPAVRRALREAEERKNRLRAETTLERREKHFRAVSENSLDIVSLLNRDGNFTYNSQAMQRVLGYESAELLGRSAFSLVHEDDVERVRDNFFASVANPDLTITKKFRIRHKDGSWRYMESICKSMLDDPEIGGVVVNSRDVSERHRIELYNSALSTLGLKLSSAISADEAARIIFQTAESLFGWDACTLNLYSPEEDKLSPVLSIDTINGRKCEIPSSEIEDAPTARARRILTRGAELTLREEPLRISTDGVGIGDKTRPSASLMFVPMRNRTRVIGILSIQSYKLKAYDAQDLKTLQAIADHCGGALERVRVEGALRESERRFRQFFEDSPDAVFVENFDGHVLDVNLAASRLHGMPREELIGKNITELVPPAQREETLRAFHKLVSGESHHIEGMTLTADGREIPVEVRTSRIDYSDKPALLLHVRDVSERKQAEDALKSSEIRFHSVWENSVDGMRLTDENGIIVAVNEAFCKLVGMPREELEGQPWTVSYAESPELTEKLVHYKERFQTRTVESRFQRKMTFRNGKTAELEGSNSFVESRGQKTLVLGLFRDVTEHRKLEEQLLHAQKMEAIGQLAGGVAHDFNNILTVIQGHASLLRSAAKQADTPSSSADQIYQAAERASGLTRQLLTFSRRQMMQPKHLDLNQIVSNTTRMLGRILGEDISLQFNYASNVPLVHADAGMIEQVLLNLAVNSRDAMPSGGELTIKIYSVDFKPEDVREYPERRIGEFVRLSVSDTGSGIDAETLPRIFEPFFTTKAIGKGTGLGLATVYGIIKQHKGWIEVESRIGEGTSFHVFLPAAEEKAVAKSSDTTAEESPRGGTETILVVEDEPPVRELVSKILTGCGYRVLKAHNGVEALKIWHQHSDKIDLLLTDIVMPDGMTGRDLAEKIQAERPGLKAIFTSGYSSDIVGKDFVIEEGVNYLQKPYIPQKLMRAIRKCLDGK